MVDEALDLILESIKSGGKIMLCGNGGSAADCQHFAAELVGRFQKNRRAIPALALTTDTSVLTAIANDFGFDHVFSRQIEAIGKPGDVLIAISTSGKSQNILRACETARQMGCKVIALTGMTHMIADVLLSVDEESTSDIQEAHEIILHTLAGEIEKSCLPH